VGPFAPQKLPPLGLPGSLSSAAQGCEVARVAVAAPMVMLGQRVGAQGVASVEDSLTDFPQDTHLDLFACALDTVIEVHHLDEVWRLAGQLLIAQGIDMGLGHCQQAALPGGAQPGRAAVAGQ
jgi:hypothetical protein